MNRCLCMLIITMAGIALSAPVRSQKLADNLVRVTGVVIDADDPKEIPYANIRVKGRSFGTVSNSEGNFSILMNLGDTLVFSYVGYRETAFILPATLDHTSYALIQLMRRDTIMLEEVVIFPWPEFDDFKQVFMDTKPRRNLDDLGFEVKRDFKDWSKEEYDENKYMYDQYRYNRLYDLHGMVAPNNFLNPLKWSDFVRDIRRDARKKKRKN